MTRAAHESDLDFAEAARKFNHDLLRAETAIKNGVRARARSTVIQLASHQRIGKERADELAWRQSDSRWGGPRIPRRAPIKVGRRSLLERLVEFLTRLRLALRERCSLAVTWLRACVQRRPA